MAQAPAPFPPCLTDKDCVVTGGLAPKCVINGAAGVCSPKKSSTTNTPAATPKANQAGNKSTGGVSIPMIIGVVAGAAVLLAIVIGFLIIRKRRARRAADDRENTKDIEQDDAPTFIKKHAARSKRKTAQEAFNNPTLVPVEMSSSPFTPEPIPPPPHATVTPPPIHASRTSMASSRSARTAYIHPVAPPQALPDGPSHDTLLRHAANNPYPIYQPMPLGPTNPHGLGFYFTAFDTTYTGTLDTATGQFRFNDQYQCDDYYYKLNAVPYYMESRPSTSGSGSDYGREGSTTLSASGDTAVDSEKQSPRMEAAYRPSLDSGRPTSVFVDAGFRPRGM
ncbi:uncharacterized protein SPPG_09182 [Spizellomyces punctatus DAOM BR117]|uniref:Uncharacterized protein n=1 Tax=Spizellomyces punctatus (strain DAOM BR117) TaxID=645134 RepID=A0A0L0HJ66_SPIPD|nr:uncharacterized protein SPPG_09182 [Spizellomyces punctatus DAOM BR117]KND01142.1 hypothetical protein SPPG_09182 [Spizellomyces punctatus DAOM BR117]|eukprot:XP_016609181.1 hypothetical protein SPPG_09182 [Spizellomyces punctatus DAOM BR117]